MARRHVTLTLSGICAKVLSWLRSILSVVQRNDFFLRQLGVLRTKLDHALLSPKTLVSPAIRNKSAVPTDIGSDQGDERILHERGVSKRGEGHQRIVLGREDQCWHVDLSCNGQRTPSTIIIGRVAVTPFRRRYRVVPFPQGPRPEEPICAVSFRKQLGFSLHRVSHAAKKVRFIDKVSRLAAAVRAGGKVETRTDRTDSAQLSRRPLRKFPRHLEHEIAARRITRKEAFRQI